MYSCHLFLISSSVGSLPFLFFVVSILSRNIPLISPTFLKRLLVFPILLFSFISLHYSLKKAFLSPLAILWKSAFSWYIFPFLPCLLLFFFPQLFVKPPQTTIFAFIAFLFLGDGLDHCLLYSVRNLHPQFFRHSVYQISSLESVCPLNPEGYLFTYLAVPGLSCGMWHFQLWPGNS